MENYKKRTTLLLMQKDDSLRKNRLKRMSTRLIMGCLLLLFGLFVSLNTFAQCVGFAKAVVKPGLSPYLHDGNYNATILGEGETIVLKKTIFEGQKYRLIARGAPELPGIHFRVLDADSSLLFDNATVEYASQWDFDVQTTRTIQVEVTVLEDENPDASSGGCVAILFGLDMD